MSSPPSGLPVLNSQRQPAVTAAVKARRSAITRTSYARFGAIRHELAAHAGSANPDLSLVDDMSPKLTTVA